MKNIIWKKPDGSIAITTLTADCMETPQEHAVTLMSRGDVPADHVAEGYTVPVAQDRYFRAAWTHTAGQGVHVDMPKARNIHMNEIRRVRDKELARLDIEQLKGADVAAQKLALRNIPQTFDLSQAETPEALKVLFPAELAGA